jgi:hypothetical protein
MSSSTFKKALGMGNSKSGGGRSGHRKPRPSSRKKTDDRSPRKRAGSGKEKATETEHVQNLIDLVD